MTQLFELDNGRQSVWQVDNNYYVVSTSIDSSELMIFKADNQGKIISWQDLYVDYNDVRCHHYHLEKFLKENNGS